MITKLSESLMKRDHDEKVKAPSVDISKESSRKSDIVAANTFSWDFEKVFLTVKYLGNVISSTHGRNSLGEV